MAIVEKQKESRRQDILRSDIGVLGISAPQGLMLYRDVGSVAASTASVNLMESELQRNQKTE
jgi:hypothetical protein